MTTGNYKLDEHYRKTSTGFQIQTLVDLTIDAAFINEDATSIILKTNDGRYFEITHRTDCCEWVYFAHVNSAEFLIGAKILMADAMEWKDLMDTHQHEAKSGSGKTDILDSMGITLSTDKGFVQLETRAEGNGQYSCELSVNDMAMNEPTNVREKDGSLYTYWINNGKESQGEKYSPLKDF
jgi:hypothetical protein